MQQYIDKIDLTQWTNKYKPRKIKDIYGNSDKVKAIGEWLDDYNSMGDKNRGTGKRKKIVIKDDDDDLDGQGDELRIGEISDAMLLENNIPELLTQSSPSKKVKNNKNKSCLIVTGGHGTGKTSIVQCILQSKKYEIHQIDLSKITQMKGSKDSSAKEKKNGKDKKKKQKGKDNKDPGKVLMQDFIEKTMKGVNICDIILGEKKKKIVIIIDELESIVSPVEKNFIANVLKQNDCEWVCPIIFIANNHHSKTISTVRTNSYEVQIDRPETEIMKIQLLKICSNEKICLEDEELADLIIEHSQHDYRRLISLLQDIKEIYGGKIFNHQDFDEYSKLSKMKDIDRGLFGTTNMLMHGYNNIGDTLRLYETDKILIPLMVQQNYITTLNASYNVNNKIHIAKQISDSLAEGDIVENYIFGTNNWDLQEVQGFLSCTYPSFVMTQTVNPTKKNPDNIFKKYLFPLDLNRTSIKKINYTKNIVNARRHFHNMEIDDYIYLNKVVKGAITIGDADECNDLFSGYDCSIGSIESVIKIDKIQESKYSIPSNIKKKLKTKESE